MNKTFTLRLFCLSFSLFFATYINVYSQSCAGNLLTNSGFESSLSNWSNWGNLRTSTFPHSGTLAGNVAPAGSGGGSNSVSGIGGNRYTLTAFAKRTNATDYAEIGLTFYNSAWQELEHWDVAVTTTSYTQYSITAIAPYGTAYVAATMWKGNTGELWVDDYCLTTQTVTGTLALGNRLFFDNNGNGIYEHDKGDWGIDGQSVVLYGDSDNNGVADGPPIATTTTVNGGMYNFSGLAAGNYFVQLESVPSWMYLSPINGGDPDNDIDNDNNGLIQNTTSETIKGGTITLALNNEPGGINYNSSYDFGVYKYNGLGDFVWLDANANGQQDSGENGMAGVTVKLYNAANNALLATTTTDANGYYFFGDPGGIYGVNTYNVEFESPIGYKPTHANKVADDEKDSDAVNGWSSNITVPIGTWNNSIDAGFVPIGVALPVKMVSFTASLSSTNTAILNWETTNEDNLNHFVIEKSTDGRNFENIGIVFSTGQQSGSGKYIFNDNLGQTNNVKLFYYRLRSVDNDAKFQLSDTRLIKLSTGNQSVSVSVYPNPVISELRISIPVKWQNKPVAYSLVNMAGQTIKQLTKTNANQTEIISMSSIQAGMYTLITTCNGEVSTQKIIKN